MRPRHTTTLISKEAFTAWGVMKDVSERRVSVGNNPVSRWLFRRRADKLVEKLGSQLGEMRTSSRTVFDMEVQLGPRESAAVEAATWATIQSREEFQDRVGPDTDIGEIWRTKDLALKGLRRALTPPKE